MRSTSLERIGGDLSTVEITLDLPSLQTFKPPFIKLQIYNKRITQNGRKSDWPSISYHALNPISGDACLPGAVTEQILACYLRGPNTDLNLCLKGA